MKEYGGYIEFENQNDCEYHKEALVLNCDRNCLAYIIEKNIKKYIYRYFMYFRKECM